MHVCITAKARQGGNFRGYKQTDDKGMSSGHTRQLIAGAGQLCARNCSLCAPAACSRVPVDDAVACGAAVFAAPLVPVC
jgi:hypothetical protein